MIPLMSAVSGRGQGKSRADKDTDKDCGIVACKATRFPIFRFVGQHCAHQDMVG